MTILQVDEVLGRPGGVHACGPGTRKKDGPGGPFPAPHGQDHSPGPDLERPAGGAGQHGAVASDRENDAAEHRLDSEFLHFPYVALGVFGAAQGLLEPVEPEAVMDALVEHASQAIVPFDEQDIPASLFSGGHGRGKAGGAAADHDDIATYARHGNISCLAPSR